MRKINPLFGCVSALFALLLILKIVGLVDWSWLWVISPLPVYLVIIASVVLGLLLTFTIYLVFLKLRNEYLY
ncbi:MAG: hypothetical protein ACYS80_15025 [Planctomycetota bacterium]